MKTIDQKEQFILRVRKAAAAILDIPSLREEYIATNAGVVLTDADFIGTNEGILVAELISFFGSAVAQKIETDVVDSVGVRTVLENLKGIE